MRLRCPKFLRRPTRRLTDAELKAALREAGIAAGVAHDKATIEGNVVNGPPDPKFREGQLVAFEGVPHSDTVTVSAAAARVVAAAPEWTPSGWFYPLECADLRLAHELESDLEKASDYAAMVFYRERLNTIAEFRRGDNQASARQEAYLKEIIGGLVGWLRGRTDFAEASDCLRAAEDYLEPAIKAGATMEARDEDQEAPA